MQQVDHGPQVTSLFDVHLKQIPQIVQAGTALPEPSLLLDAGRLGVALGDDQATERVAVLAGHLLTGPDEPNIVIEAGVPREDESSTARLWQLLGEVLTDADISAG